MKSKTVAKPKGVVGQRASRTAQAMFDAKLERTRALSAVERMKLALRLGQKAKRAKHGPRR